MRSASLRKKLIQECLEHATLRLTGRNPQDALVQMLILVWQAKPSWLS